MSVHRWDRCHPLIGQKAPMIRRHVARPNKGPYRLKRPALSKAVVLTQVLVGQPNNDLLNKGPFTA